MMAGLPTTFEITRAGTVETVPVPDQTTLLALRTELELVRRFGAGADRRVLEAIDARLDHVRSGVTARDGIGVEDIEDMRKILTDAPAATNAAAIARVDQDHP